MERFVSIDIAIDEHWTIDEIERVIRGHGMKIVNRVQVEMQRANLKTGYWVTDHDFERAEDLTKHADRCKVKGCGKPQIRHTR